MINILLGFLIIVAVILAIWSIQIKRKHGGGCGGSCGGCTIGCSASSVNNCGGNCGCADDYCNHSNNKSNKLA